jgi:hypothetical protein
MRVYTVYLTENQVDCILGAIYQRNSEFGVTGDPPDQVEDSLVEMLETLRRENI